MNLDDFSYEENGRRYIDPNVSLNEQNAFIQNLRDTQAQRNTQIAQQTHDLGTDVPSNLGGLTGSESYFNSRYQTPQTNSLVADLKATAQAQALNTALNNELEKAKKRYNDAYKASQSGGGGGDDQAVNGDVEFVPVGDEYELKYKGTDEWKSSLYHDPVTDKNTTAYHLLGPNGERVPMDFAGAGSTMVLSTPNGDYDGADAAKKYIDKMRGRGYKLVWKSNDGKTHLVTGYPAQWGN